MGRPAKYDREGIARAALELIAEGGVGAATVAAIAGRLGAPLFYGFGGQIRVLPRTCISCRCSNVPLGEP